MKNKLKKLVMLCLCFWAYGMVQAAGQLPEIQNKNNVTFMIGGATTEESTAMVEESKKWTLHVEFKEQQGKSNKPLSGVELQVINQDGKTVFDERCNGPIFLAKLAPGKYQLHAKYEGVIKKNSAVIAEGKSTKVNFHWTTKK